MRPQQPEKKLRIPEFTVQLCGSPDFVHRVGAALRRSISPIKLAFGNITEAWSSMLTQRPHVLLVEIGPQHSERSHLHLRALMERTRDRFGSDVYIIAALTTSERLFYGGDLLFSSADSLNPSGYVDSFVALAPGSIPSISPLAEQINHAVKLAAQEIERRAGSQIALPALNDPGWAQSLVDPVSRELWMRWLPRYASYTNENPLIVGETGTGKTNLAYALHRLSGRKGQFVSITPRDFSSSELVQAELFGAVAGAYTGAVDKWGLVKSAEKGTLFIDELQSIDKELQGKLITFIENKSYRRVGSAESISADVRFVFASNRTIYDMMKSEILRHDFAYRLERVQLDLLPLSSRRLDICAALGFALAKLRRQRPQAHPVTGFSSPAFRLLFSQRWPGNLRQLENRVAQLCELADMEQTPLVDEQMVASLFKGHAEGVVSTTSDVVAQAARILCEKSLREEVASIQGGISEFLKISREIALEANAGDPDRAAKLLGEDSHLLSLLGPLGTAARELGA